MTKIEISQFRVGGSNYCYVLYHPETKVGVVIDPLEDQAVLREVKRLGVSIKTIVNTHGHMDHIAGNEGVQRQTQATIAAGEKEEIPGVQEKLKNGQTFVVAGIEMKIYHTPGHTAGHICLAVEGEYLMVGDTLFLGGCGNCKFGGNADDLFETLETLKRLPGHLRIYCGHHYAEKNLQFCRQYDPENRILAQRQKEILEKLRRGVIPVTTLDEEKEHNVFLRSHEPSVYQNLHKEFSNLPPDPKSVFKKLRELRNSF